MELKTFADIILKEIRGKMDEVDHISIISNVKNNGIRFTGILFQNEREHISPTIYIDDLYEDYKKNQNPISDIVNEVADRYKKTMEGIHDICSLSVDYEMCREKIIYRLVSIEKNKEALKNVPYIPFLDLAITFHLAVAIHEEYVQSMRIDKDMLERWQVSVEELFARAKQNTSNLLPPKIRELGQMIGDYTHSKKRTEELTESHKKDGIKKEKLDMIVITNRLGINGASVILYEGVIEKLAEKFASDLYLLPSSIHEMIVVPAYDKTMYDPLCVMVKSINQGYVEKDEILSDRVYLYKREEKRFQ